MQLRWIRFAGFGLALGLASACSVVSDPVRDPGSTARAQEEKVAVTSPSETPANVEAAQPAVDLHAAAKSTEASAAEDPPTTRDPITEVLALPSVASTSIGGPSRGKLVGGVALPERGPGYYHNPKRPAEARYGTVELVSALVRAAAVVERELPGSSLTINDLSLIEGGPIKQHGSHQNGRDVDILFYVLDGEGKPLPSVGVPLDPKGRGWDFKDLRVPEDDQRVQLDAPRTWRFMQALLEQAPDAVQRIFIVEHLRTQLLAQAEKVRAPKPVRDRFADITCQPGTPHDDHMHVRFFCTPEDMAEGCEDSPPVYPFRTAELSALGLSPVLAAPKTRAERARTEQRTTTPEQAKKRAGPMHAAVHRFLGERKAWQSQPHPGRAYCR